MQELCDTCIHKKNAHWHGQRLVRCGFEGELTAKPKAVVNQTEFAESMLRLIVIECSGYDDGEVDV